MKIKLTMIVLALASANAWSQEKNKMFTVSGGYAFADVEEVTADATGWRLNGLYEYCPGGIIAHGFSFGFIGTTADYSAGTNGSSVNLNYDINSWPIYYAPKLLIGNSAFKGFVKGALGVQYSSIKVSGSRNEGWTSDFGFYGGASGGFMLEFENDMFVNVEYEFAYLSNSYYRDGFMNSAMLGVGYKF